MAHDPKKRMLENPSYRPDWKDVWDEANQRHQDAIKHGRYKDAREALGDLHAAHWMQFPTMAAIRDFQFKHVELHAHQYGVPANLPKLRDDSTLEEITDAFSAAYKSVEERGSQHLRIA